MLIVYSVNDNNAQNYIRIAEILAKTLHFSLGQLNHFGKVANKLLIHQGTAVLG